MLVFEHQRHNYLNQNTIEFLLYFVNRVRVNVFDVLDRDVQNVPILNELALHQNLYLLYECN